MFTILSGNTTVVSVLIVGSILMWLYLLNNALGGICGQEKQARVRTALSAKRSRFFPVYLRIIRSNMASTRAAAASDRPAAASDCEAAASLRPAAASL